MAIDDPDYPGLRIAGEFGAVEQYLVLLLEYLPMAREQTRLHSEMELKRKYPKHSRVDFSDDYDQIEWVSDTLVPKFFLGSFIMVSWAAFEMASVEIATYVLKKEKVRLRLSDLRSNGWEKLQLYLETIWSKEIAISDVYTNRIKGLQAVRNLLAHANGNLDFERDGKRRTEIQKLIESNVGVSLHENDIFVSENFLWESLRSLVNVINILLEEIESRYSLK